jgi:cysteine desulfuration protein SufE
MPLKRHKQCLLKMATIQEIQTEIVEEFDMFEDWMEKYEYIIELGRELPIIDDKYKNEEHIIKGCQSRVWLHAANINGKIQLTADSDAIITKGIISLLIKVLNNQKHKDVINASNIPSGISDPSCNKIAELVIK